MLISRHASPESFADLVGHTLQQATAAARARTGDAAISVSVAAGKFTITRVTFDQHGKATVVPLSGPHTFTEALDALAKVGG